VSYLKVVWKVFNSDDVLDFEVYYFTSEGKAYDKILELSKVMDDKVWDYKRCEVQ